MVHDRQVDGKTYVFGNQGGLFMQAMTWWDHETGSVWSQVWGQAISGPLKGTSLRLIPAAIVPWATWKAEHPDTLALVADDGSRFFRQERPRDGWVIGVAIDEHSKAFPFTAAAQAGVINDAVGPFPVAVYADGESRNVHVYLRQAGGQVLTLALDPSGEFLVDGETGSRWNIDRGQAVEGPLKGESLLLVPYVSAFDWAWLDFHPESAIYGE